MPRSVYVQGLFMVPHGEAVRLEHPQKPLTMSSSIQIRQWPRALLMTWLSYFAAVFCTMGTLELRAQQCLAGGCTEAGVLYGTTQSTTSNTFVTSVPNTYNGEYNEYNVTS